MINITDKFKCSGCHACYNACPQNCVEMISDQEGFWYPQIQHDRCVNCGLCEKVCPILSKESTKTLIKPDPIAYAAYNTDEKIRMQSSSGGVFTLLAEEIIKQHGVVFGACFDENFQVIHSYAETIDDLEKFRGSKYVQSKIGDTFSQAKNFLEDDRFVLFTGTPCQISGLKRYLRKEYDNLFCQDICCHGVPSPKVWKKYLVFKEQSAHAKIRQISFRCKDNSWKHYSVSMLFDNDTRYQQLYKKDFMMSAFLRNICLRPSCYKCANKTLQRESDITLADFWGIHTIIPEMDDDKGTSLLIVHSEKGKQLLNSIKGHLILKEADLTNALHYNHSMCSASSCNPKREAFFLNLDELDFDKLIKKYCTYSLWHKCKKKITYILSKRKTSSV